MRRQPAVDGRDALFHLDGPNRERALPPPDGYSGPDSVLAGEERLARAVDAVAAAPDRRGPALIARSYQQAWRPGIIAKAGEQDSIAHASLPGHGSLATTIDSSLAASGSSVELATASPRASTR